MTSRPIGMFADGPSIAHAFNQIRAIERAAHRSARCHPFGTGLLATGRAGINAVSVQTKTALPAVRREAQLRALPVNVATGARRVAQFGGAQTGSFTAVAAAPTVTGAGLLTHQGTDRSEIEVSQPAHSADRDGGSSSVVERRDDVGELAVIHASIMNVQRSRDLEGVLA